MQTRSVLQCSLHGNTISTRFRSLAWPPPALLLPLLAVLSTRRNTEYSRGQLVGVYWLIADLNSDLASCRLGLGVEIWVVNRVVVDAVVCYLFVFMRWCAHLALVSGTYCASATQIMHRCAVQTVRQMVSTERGWGEGIPSICPQSVEPHTDHSYQLKVRGQRGGHDLGCQ